MPGLYERLVTRLARTRRGARFAATVATVIDRRLLDWTDGRISSGLGTRFGSQMLLLTARGRKSGELRTVPLLYTKDGERLIVIASSAGRPRHPAWYHNVRANPDVTVRFAGRREQRTARVTEGSEREALWRKAVDNYPGYADYQSRVEREIPVVVLESEPRK